MRKKDFSEIDEACFRQFSFFLQCFSHVYKSYVTILHVYVIKIELLDAASDFWELRVTYKQKRLQIHNNRKFHWSRKGSLTVCEGVFLWNPELQTLGSDIWKSKKLQTKTTIRPAAADLICCWEIYSTN